MKSVIVGTAGHIDHGKTALVKALTGIDADRLEEEKRRGITIDLGFAHLDLPGPGGENLRLGFVDVPGHERFVRNMLAGVGGIDLVLLVIAADESIKPQTREHFDICRLLGVQRGITVLTKADLVDAETLGVVKAEVGQFLRGSFLETPAAPLIAVSSLTGSGLDQLRAELARVAAEVAAKDSRALPRLPIDRVFTMKGFGTVVTGTLVAGSIRKADEVEILPKGQRVRVRGVQVHGHDTDQALAGQRTALNLASVATEELQRGMTLTTPSIFHATRRADVSLSVLQSAKALKNRARVHLHAYTSETIAEVVLHEDKQIAPRNTAFAQLRLADPMFLLPGDRFIVRQFSPVVTIGGGVVLDASPLKRKIPANEAVAFLNVVEGGSIEEVLAARIARRGPAGLAVSSAVAEMGIAADHVKAAADGLLAQQTIMSVDDLYISTATFSAACAQASAAVILFHEQNPLVPGISREALREQLELSPEVFSRVLGALSRDKTLEIAGEHVRAAGRRIVMKDEEAESQRIIESAFASAGLQVPALVEVLAGLKVDRIRAQKIVTLLLRDKVLIKVSQDLVFHRDALKDLRQRLATEKSRSPKLDVGRFKDLTGVSRKYAIPLLEYLDREHVTRRVENKRLIL